MIAIFGASVTQQKGGYAVALQSRFNDEVRIFGYGGMHLRDAGICFIDEVLKSGPSHCFVDWFSTGYTVANEKTSQYLDAIVHRFSQAGCKLVFLFFPSLRHTDRIVFYRFCKKYLEKHNLCCIDLNEEMENLTNVLRDGIHTTDYGSEKYSEIIHSRFEQIKDNIVIPSGVNASRYSVIGKIKVGKTFNSSIEMEGRCEIVGFLLTVGPHSGLVEIVDGTNSTISNTWDRWCHYPRKHFQLPYRSLDGRIRLNILQNNFDTSSCRVQFDFAKTRKVLIVHDIYYVGEYLRVTNIHRGLSIKEAVPPNRRGGRLVSRVVRGIVRRVL